MSKPIAPPLPLLTKAATVCLAGFDCGGASKFYRRVDMKFRINYSGEYQDSIDISGETIDEIKESAIAECKKRGWETKDCWSEKLED